MSFLNSVISNKEWNLHEFLTSVDIGTQSLPPHTHYNEKGYVVCDLGYYGDEPVTWRGCWKCSKSCLINAHCDYPGYCKCNEGFQGDGISQCAHPIPTIIGVYTNSSKYFRKGDKLAFRYMGLIDQYQPTHGFCKIGNVIIAANKCSNGKVECTIPVDLINDYSAYMSFDAISWSQPVIVPGIKLIEDVSRQKLIQLMIASIICLILLLLHTFWKNYRDRKKLD